MTTSVKHIHNAMRGAPQLSGTAGTLIAVLDALFISGWGVTTALSVNVAGGVATATLNPGDTFDRDSVILVAGATPGALNGEARVASSSNTSITWPTTAPDGAATGTITIRYAPQTSWVKVYAGTNKAVYRSTHPQSAGHFLRVDDTGTTFARVRGFESMTDVDTGVGPFPTDAQMSGGGYWWKSIAADATARSYRIFCDQRAVLIAAAPNTSTTVANLRGFGDMIALAPGGDTWSTVLSATGSNSGISSAGAFENQLVSASSGVSACARDFSGLGGGVLLDPRAFAGSATGTSGSDAWLGVLPSAVDGEVKTSRVFLRQQAAGSPPRVVVPGVRYLPQSNALSVLNSGDFLTGSGELAGRRLIVMHTGSGYGVTPSGAYLVDITGPWR
jgi:hypothetical protein